MKTETLLSLRDTAYSVAKSKGFYTEGYTDEQYIAAMHEELSEAFREWNKHGNWSQLVDGKYTGIYPELADAVIRVLSYCGYKGIDFTNYPFSTDRAYTKEDLADVLLKSHLSLSEYYDQLQREIPDDEYYETLFAKVVGKIFTKFILRIEQFVEQSSNKTANLYVLIFAKLEYNKTRPAKHGGNHV